MSILPPTNDRRDRYHAHGRKMHEGFTSGEEANDKCSNANYRYDDGKTGEMVDVFITDLYAKMSIAIRSKAVKASNVSNRASNTSEIMHT